MFSTLLKKINSHLIFRDFSSVEKKYINSYSLLFDLILQYMHKSVLKVVTISITYIIIE